MDGLHDDLCDLIVGIAGTGQFFGRGLVLEGEIAVIVDLVQQHAQGVGIRGFVNGIHGIMKFRCGVLADKLGRQGVELQRIQLYKTQITDAEFPFVGHKDIGRLQVHIHVTGAAADSQGGAEIQTQVHSLQMGHEIAA